VFNAPIKNVTAAMYTHGGEARSREERGHRQYLRSPLTGQLFAMLQSGLSSSHGFAGGQRHGDHTAVLGNAPRVGVEAGMRMGWNRWLGCNAHFVRMSDFGALAPIEALYPHFGVTAERVAETACGLIASPAAPACKRERD
jgi:hypothetical protein